MRIGILTHYDVNNQGAQLQMYALSKHLEEQGHQIFVLTYNKNFDFIPEEGKKNVVSLRSVPYYLKNYLFGKGLGLTIHNAKKYNCLKKFRTANFKFTSYHTEGIDAVIIGSDEVFSIDVGVNPMMYGHNLCCKKTIAYAPAFGRTTCELLEEQGCYALVKSGLQEIWRLSARDMHTQEMIKEMTGRDVPIVCDPVFLLDFDKLPVMERKIRKPYLLVYSYDAHMKTEDEYKEIQKFAKEHNLITVSAGTYHKWCDKNIVCDVLEWINYFRYADYVVTDTFHGYVTALKTQRPVAVFIRSAINSYKLKSLMAQTATEDREISKIASDELERVLLQPMNYKAVGERIADMTVGGVEYIADALKVDENNE